MKSKKKSAPTPLVNPLGVPLPTNDAVEVTLPAPSIDHWGRPALPVGAIALMLRQVAKIMARRAHTVHDAVGILGSVADDLLALHRAHETKPPHQSE